MVNAAITNSAVSGMPREQAGVAAGVASASRQIGQSLGVAVMGSVLSGNLQEEWPPGSWRPAAPGGGSWLLCGAIGLILGPRYHGCLGPAHRGPDRQPAVARRRKVTVSVP